MRSVGSIGACCEDFFAGGDFAERDFVERLAIATDTFPRAVIAGHDASVLPPKFAAQVLQPKFCSPSFAAGILRPKFCGPSFAVGNAHPPWGPLRRYQSRRSVLLRRISLHVSNAAISPRLAQAERGK
jgi:hypothetical protein